MQNNAYIPDKNNKIMLASFIKPRSKFLIAARCWLVFARFSLLCARCLLLCARCLLLCARCLLVFARSLLFFTCCSTRNSEGFAFWLYLIRD